MFDENVPGSCDITKNDSLLKKEQYYCAHISCIIILISTLVIS